MRLGFRELGVRGGGGGRGQGGGQMLPGTNFGLVIRQISDGSGAPDCRVLLVSGKVEQ